jgi:hypothetical protein
MGRDPTCAQGLGLTMSTNTPYMKWLKQLIDESLDHKIV